VDSAGGREWSWRRPAWLGLLGRDLCGALFVLFGTGTRSKNRTVLGGAPMNRHSPDGAWSHLAIFLIGRADGEVVPDLRPAGSFQRDRMGH